jgi:hypothetical protein
MHQAYTMSYVIINLIGLWLTKKRINEINMNNVCICLWWQRKPRDLNLCHYLNKFGIHQAYTMFYVIINFIGLWLTKKKINEINITKVCICLWWQSKPRDLNLCH